MNENYNSPIIDDEEEMDIDWAGYAVKLLNNWKFIALCTLLAAVLGVGVALLQKRTYTANVTLAPESQAKSGGGSLGGLASLVGLSGASMSGGGDALNITLFPEISQSTLFLTQLFEVEVTPYVSPAELKKGAEPANPITLYKYITKEDEKPGLMQRIKESLFGAPEDFEPDSLNIAQLSGKQRLVVEELQKAVSADVDKKTGIVTIGVTMDDPWIATTLVDTVCNRLQNYVIAYRTKKTQEDLTYYETLAEEAKEKMVKAQAAYARSVDYDRSVILQSVSSAKERLQQEAQLASEIYSQMAQQVEMAKAKLQEEKPVFAVVEAATMPVRPNNSRKNVALAFMFVGFCLSAGWKLLGEEYLQGFKQQLNDRLLDERQECAENDKEQHVEV